MPCSEITNGIILRLKKNKNRVYYKLGAHKMNFIVFADNVYNPNNICCVRRYLTQVMNFDNYTMENKHAIRIYTANNESFESVYNSEKERDKAYNDLMKMLGINLSE